MRLRNLAAANARPPSNRAIAVAIRPAPRSVRRSLGPEAPATPAQAQAQAPQEDTEGRGESHSFASPHPQPPPLWPIAPRPEAKDEQERETRSINGGCGGRACYGPTQRSRDAECHCGPLFRPVPARGWGWGWGCCWAKGQVPAPGVLGSEASLELVLAGFAWLCFRECGRLSPGRCAG